MPTPEQLERSRKRNRKRGITEADIVAATSRARSRVQADEEARLRRRAAMEARAADQRVPGQGRLQVVKKPPPDITA